MKYPTPSEAATYFTDVDWNVVVDYATCFGVYYSTKHECYNSHGELEGAGCA